MVRRFGLATSIFVLVFPAMTWAQRGGHSGHGGHHGGAAMGTAPAAAPAPMRTPAPVRSQVAAPVTGFAGRPVTPIGRGPTPIGYASPPVNGFVSHGPSVVGPGFVGGGRHSGARFPRTVVVTDPFG